MDRAMILQALRDQQPELYRSLSQAGELEQYAMARLREARRLVDEMTSNMPRNSYGNIPIHLQREAEEYARAEILDFASDLERDV